MSGFNRGKSGFEDNLKKNAQIGKLKSFFVSKNQDGSYKETHVLFMHGLEEMVSVGVHEMKASHDESTFHSALCMNEIGEVCEACAAGKNKTTRAILKLFDFSQFKHQQTNQMQYVGYKPLLASKTDVSNLQVLSDAIGGLKGKVITVTRVMGAKNRTQFSFKPSQKQLNSQQLIQFQKELKGYTDAEIVAIFPINTPEKLRQILPFTAKNNFSSQGNQGPMDFDFGSKTPSSTVGTAGSQMSNQNAFNHSSMNDMDFNPSAGGSLGGNVNASIGSEPSFNVDDSIPF